MNALSGSAVLRGSFDDEGEEESSGRSEVKARRVSAATIPPMECPIRIVWTEGSTVGEGVALETSMSITFSCSLAGIFSINSNMYKEHIHQSLNLPTHSAKSPRVSNLG